MTNNKIQLTNRDAIEFYVKRSGHIVWKDQCLVIENNQLVITFPGHTPFDFNITDKKECILLIKWFHEYGYKCTKYLDVSLIDYNENYSFILFVTNLQLFCFYVYPKNHLYLISDWINDHVTNNLPRETVQSILDNLLLDNVDLINDELYGLSSSTRQLIETILTENLPYLKE